jgi:hypothetical protein
MDDTPPTGMFATTWMAIRGAECPSPVPSRTGTSIGWASRVLVERSPLDPAEPSCWRGGNNILRDPSSSATERLCSMLPVAETGWQKSAVEHSKSSQKGPILPSKPTESIWTKADEVSNPPTTEASEILRRPENLLRREKKPHRETSDGVHTIPLYSRRLRKGSLIYSPPFF